MERIYLLEDDDSIRALTGLLIFGARWRAPSPP